MPRFSIWPGASRREENHQRWEDNDPRGAIRAKGRLAAQESARRAGRTQRAERRNQRNNRREY